MCGINCGAEGGGCRCCSWCSLSFSHPQVSPIASLSFKIFPPDHHPLLLHLSQLLCFFKRRATSSLSIILPVFSLGGRLETAFLCKYLLFMKTLSLSALHRCGHGTDKMLIAPWLGPLLHSSPCRNLAGAQTRNRLLGQGRLEQGEKGSRRKKGQGREKKRVMQSFLEWASILILLE